MQKKREEIQPIIDICVRGTPAELQALLEQGVSANLRTEDDESLLTFSIAFQRADMVRVLIAARVDVEQLDSGWSPLMYAADEGDLEIAQQLLQAGAQLERKDGCGRDAAEIADSRGHRAVSAFLRARRRP